MIQLYVFFCFSWWVTQRVESRAPWWATNHWTAGRMWMKLRLKWFPGCRTTLWLTVPAVMLSFGLPGGNIIAGKLSCFGSSCCEIVSTWCNWEGTCRLAHEYLTWHEYTKMAVLCSWILLSYDLMLASPSWSIIIANWPTAHPPTPLNASYQNNKDPYFVLKMFEWNQMLLSSGSWVYCGVRCTP